MPEDDDAGADDGPAGAFWRALAEIAATYDEAARAEDEAGATAGWPPRAPMYANDWSDI